MLVKADEILEKKQKFSRFSRFSRFFKNVDFSKNIFQSHLKKFLLDGFSKFWNLEMAEIIRFHEHLKSFNSTDSSLRNRERSQHKLEIHQNLYFFPAQVSKSRIFVSYLIFQLGYLNFYSSRYQSQGFTAFSRSISHYRYYRVLI